MDMVQVICPEPLAPVLSLSHSHSLLLLPRVGVEEPFEEDQNEHRWQYFRWHEGILLNKLTGPGFSHLSNLRCFSLCCLSLSSCVYQSLAPFSKGARGQVNSNNSPTLSLGCLMYQCSWDYVPMPCILDNAGMCLLVQLSLVFRAPHLQSHKYFPHKILLIF